MSRAGLVGGAVGVAVAGAAGAAVASRELQRRHASEPISPDAPATRTSTVVADDGTPLVVEEVGKRDAELTVVFVHGYCLRMESWHFQRELMAERPGVRSVFYDQRGHGRSGTAPGETYTIDQLGRDLRSVLRTVVPTGPVVLVGHSMGGMSIMAFARQRPDLIEQRTVGVALLSTAADTTGLDRFGAVLGRLAVAAMQRLGDLPPAVLRAGRAPVDLLIRPVVRAMSYGDSTFNPVIARLSERMIAATPVRTIADFLPTLSTHNELDALPALTGLPVLVLCGDADRLTPVRHTRVIADVLTEADLVIAPGAGHLVQLEQPELVDEALTRLLERCDPDPRAHRVADAPARGA